MLGYPKMFKVGDKVKANEHGRQFLLETAGFGIYADSTLTIKDIIEDAVFSILCIPEGSYDVIAFSPQELDKLGKLTRKVNRNRVI